MAARPPRGAVRLLDQALVLVGCTLLVALFGTVLLGIVTRAFNDPLTWTDEAARFLMVWLACAGWIIAGRRSAHVRISFFLDRAPAGLRRVVNVLIPVALVALGAVMAWFGVILVGRNLDMEANALPISAAWLYGPIVPAGAALVVQALTQLRDAASPTSAVPGEGLHEGHPGGPGAARSVLDGKMAE